MVYPRKPSLEDRFIGPMERRERILALMPARGFASMNQLAEAAGMTWTGLNKALKSDRITAYTICRLAAALDCTVKFLLER